MIDAGIADGSIDTVVIGFPDMQGRPVGKRVTADYFALARGRARDRGAASTCWPSTST